MERRDVLMGSGALISLLAGCTGGDGSANETTTSQPIDSGVVFDATLSAMREEQVTLSASQKITVETSEIEEGEELTFILGDGSKFVHKEAIRQNETTEFPVKSDGWHNIKLSPDRYEAPVDKDVQIHAKVTLSEP
jgi:hypothetical protein